MATSGRMQGNSITIGGNGGNYYFIDWQLAGQSAGGNYSTINWQAYMHYNSADAQLDNGYVNAGGATRWANGGRVYNYAGNFTTRDMGIASGSFNIGHDAYGNCTLGIDGNIVVYSGQNTGGSAAWALPSLASVPSITSDNPTNIGLTTVTGNGNVTWGGNYPISTRGICYSTSANPTTGNSKVAVGGTTGAFSASITGLTANTTYHYRAYATNGIGTSYGADKSFTTLMTPVVTTAAATNIAGTTTTANGNLTNAGNPTITEKGFVYGTSDSPTTANTKAIVTGSSTGAYSANLTGLTPSTLYYSRSYAINSTGTVYGNQQTFSTIVLATVLTTAATSVMTTSADGHGEITSDGGGAVTERGFAWGTSANPTIAGTHLAVGSGTGTFTDTMPSLTPSLTYHYRAYATNSAGTSYGSDQTFSTEATPPAQPSNLTPTGGIATDDLTPTLAWQYNPGSANDEQYAYQVIVIRQSDSVEMWDSTKTVSAAGTVDVPGGASLAYDVAYQWKVKSWNQDDVASAYSGLALFKESEKPTGTLTYPDNAETIITNIPIMTWDYVDPEATTQAKYWLRIYDNLNALIHDTGWVISADALYEVADNILANHSSYKVSLIVEDTDGMQSVADENYFDIEFLAPSLPIVGATQDVAGIVTIGVQLIKPPLDGWFAETLNLYRKQQGQLTWDTLEANIPLLENILSDCEATAGWTESGVARAPGVTTAKYGTNSLGLGVTGAGDGIYTKTIDVTDLADYDTFKAFVYVTATNNISSIDFKIGTDASNYYLISTPVSGLAAGSWNPIFAPTSEWVQVGYPDPADLNVLIAEIKNATGSITLNQIRIDRVGLAQSNYSFSDYTTAATQIITYGVSALSIEANVSSNIAESPALTIRFTEDKINTYLVPLDNLELTVKGFMDGSQPPSWSHKTETKYYQTKGARTPVSVVNAIQNYIEGEMQLRFFDAKFNGQGITGVESLQVIKNIKPLLLRTWWGRNYYISIDGVIDTTRRSGIGWYASFSFTEITP